MNEERHSNSIESARYPLICFYDGHCGLCHQAVKWLLPSLDPASPLRFAPLQGEIADKLQLEAVWESQNATPIPDSILVYQEGFLLARTDALISLIAHTKGFKKSLLGLLRWLPKRFRDWGYTQLAKVRKGIFGTKEDLCPLLPKDLRFRFLP